jgi:hypothetical protein
MAKKPPSAFDRSAAHGNEDEPAPWRKTDRITKRSQLSSMPMTSLKQTDANRRNALRSTGPTSDAGKARSRQNASTYVPGNERASRSFIQVW